MNTNILPVNTPILNIDPSETGAPATLLPSRKRIRATESTDDSKLPVDKKFKNRAVNQDIQGTDYISNLCNELKFLLWYNPHMSEQDRVAFSSTNKTNRQFYTQDIANCTFGQRSVLTHMHFMDVVGNQEEADLNEMYLREYAPDVLDLDIEFSDEAMQRAKTAISKGLSWFGLKQKECTSLKAEFFDPTGFTSMAALTVRRMPIKRSISILDREAYSDYNLAQCYSKKFLAVMLTDPRVSVKFKTHQTLLRLITQFYAEDRPINELLDILTNLSIDGTSKFQENILRSWYKFLTNPNMPSEIRTDLLRVISVITTNNTHDAVYCAALIKQHIELLHHPLTLASQAEQIISSLNLFVRISHGWGKLVCFHVFKDFVAHVSSTHYEFSALNPVYIYINSYGTDAWVEMLTMLDHFIRETIDLEVTRYARTIPMRAYNSAPSRLKEQLYNCTTNFKYAGPLKFSLTLILGKGMKQGPSILHGKEAYYVNIRF